MKNDRKNSNYLKDIRINFKKIYKILNSINRLYIPVTIFVTIIMGVLPSISVVIMQSIVNSLQLDNTPKRTFFFVFIYILFDFLTTQIQNLHSYYTGIFQLKVSLTMSQLLLAKTDSLTLHDFEDTESYNKIQRAAQQSDVQIFFYFTNVLSLLQYFVTMLSSALLLLYWKWWTVFLIILISSISSIIMTKLSEEQYEIIRNRTGEDRERWYYQYLLTYDIAFKEIKIYGLNHYFRKKHKEISAKFLHQDKGILKKHTITNVVMGFLENSVTAFIFILIILDTFAKKILLGDAIAYIRYMSNISSTVKSFLNQIVSIFSSTLYINQLFEFLDMPREERTDGVTINEINCIEFRNLSYRYNNSTEYVLKNVSLKIEKGENIAIVGMNGSGKSTLIKILIGLYDDYEGDVFINSVNIKKINPKSFKKQIGILFQDYTKYELSLRENIGVANLKELNNSQYIERVLKAANINSNLITNLDQQLGFWFKNGRQLSGGEWIRIGIGRALASEADMYIFDEPNASLDSIAEREVFLSLKKLLTDKIGIIITHRIAGIKILESKIVVMDKGQIISYGNHESLLKTCVIYRRLYESSIE